MKNRIFSTLFVLFSATLLWMGCSAQAGYHFEDSYSGDEAFQATSVQLQDLYNPFEQSTLLAKNHGKCARQRQIPAQRCAPCAPSRCPPPSGCVPYNGYPPPCGPSCPVPCNQTPKGCTPYNSCPPSCGPSCPVPCNSCPPSGCAPYNSSPSCGPSCPVPCNSCPPSGCAPCNSYSPSCGPSCPVPCNSCPPSGCAPYNSSPSCGASCAAPCNGCPPSSCAPYNSSPSCGPSCPVPCNSCPPNACATYNDCMPSCESSPIAYNSSQNGCGLCSMPSGSVQSVPTEENPCPQPNPCCGRINTTYVENCGVRVTAKQPQMCNHGDTYNLDLEVVAQRDVCDVVITAILPCGVSLIRSSPEGVVNNGKHITWKIEGMKCGECINNRLTLRAECEGQMCVCFCVTAVPVQFCAVLCARPLLQCSKVGPCEVSLCDTVNYCISVTNTGSCAAEDVVVIDQVPLELEHCSRQRTLTFNLGKIEPCQTKKFGVPFRAVKLGKACNTIVVTSCNANQCSDTFCTLVTQCGIDIQKQGPEEVKIGGTAVYNIVVTNTGNKNLTDVVIVECAPQATTIVDAKGAQIRGNEALWKFANLKPGEKQTVNAVLTTCTPGYATNRVQVTSAQGCSANAEAITRWRGSPGLNVQIINPTGPICVGDVTTYYIRVVNQGSEDDQNVAVTVRFPASIMPTSISGSTSGKINNGVVLFNPAYVLGPRQTLEYRVDAIARESSDSRIKVDVSSDTFKTPIIQEESTIVH